ncbi:hypothetical protein M758_3G198900 [Ceratodon purpureus]|uniref:Uncharacterized protein n=1 Tax=Ceratodon purpureus TaxID=3225 RepID=A0A8T0IN73_CERPU|nr:hypothetical protein KC19_3G199800 [Ceratodon purpureus]KAG0623752.1 hypothetical protein M758_3G198900 [Ceratodon purpureus]
MPLQESFDVVDLGESRGSTFLYSIKYLWVPSLLLVTVLTREQYPPYSAILFLFLLWNTNPNFASIYAWIAKNRMEDFVRRRLLERPRDHIRYMSFSAVDSNPTPLEGWQTGYLHSFLCDVSLDPTATVVHVQTRDLALFSIARITTITQYVTLFGILGNWVVISVSETILSAAGQERMRAEFEEKMETVRREGGRVIEEKINEMWTWWTTHTGSQSPRAT